MSQKPTPNDLRKLADDWNRDRQDDGEILHWAVCQAADEIERLQKDLKGTENARDQYTDWHGVARAEVRAALQAHSPKPSPSVTRLLRLPKEWGTWGLRSVVNFITCKRKLIV